MTNYVCNRHLSWVFDLLVYCIELETSRETWKFMKLVAQARTGKFRVSSPLKLTREFDKLTWRSQQEFEKKPELTRIKGVTSARYVQFEYIYDLPLSSQKSNLQITRRNNWRIGNSKELSISFT